ncbi:hypothetical protein VTK73DRAFT_8266 [Phialemonium thermophilum]|uniref:Mitochondrial carrier protein n=1 Tax=Phialemonium thermophilum TaxID=223376 RepID=A0ABR3W9B5_9PEZI
MSKSWPAQGEGHGENTGASYQHDGNPKRPIPETVIPPTREVDREGTRASSLGQRSRAPRSGSESHHRQSDVILAGAVAAFTVDLLVYPLDTIKTRWQSQDFVKTYASGTSVKRAPPNVFRGLYQGVGSVVVATVPAAGVFFTTYESAKSLYGSILPAMLPLPAVHALASGTAELASCLVLTPAEVIKQNAQMLRQSSGGRTRGGRSTSLEAWRMVRQSEGGAMRRLWSGYTALAARNLPYTAMQFPMFEFFRGRLWGWRKRSLEKAQTNMSQDNQELGQGVRSTAMKSDASESTLLVTGLINGASAGLSGAIAAVITTPIDVVKTRMMVMTVDDIPPTPKPRPEHESGGPGSRLAQRSLGTWQVGKQVYLERGIPGLFRGGLLRAVWTALGSGLYLGTYEVSKAWLRGSRTLQNDGDL